MTDHTLPDDKLQTLATPGASQDDKVLILDWGGPYKQLLGQLVRDLEIYCEIRPATLSASDIKRGGYRALILVGGERSVLDDHLPEADPDILKLDLPVLGIGLGAHWLAVRSGGTVNHLSTPARGTYTVEADPTSSLLEGLPASFDVWMDHGDTVTALPEQWETHARAPEHPHAAFSSPDGRLVGLGFHPEVSDSAEGETILRHFLFDIAGLEGAWRIDDFIESSIASIKRQVGDGRVLAALSGGVDSSVASLLVHRAVGDQLTCIFVDHGLLRKHEADQVEKVFREHFNMDVRRVDASARFFEKLKGVTDPEQKRKVIGEEFIRVFEAEAQKLGDIDYLVQGTIYPDIIESGVDGTVIKSHHNVGGLPKDIGFTGLIEPLRDLFKEEVRAVGRKLGIAKEQVERQPFPGPGLGVRILGEVTKEKADLLRDADAIFREEIDKAGLTPTLSQYFAILTDLRSVGVKHNRRTYDYTLGLRAVITDDFMTAAWARLPYEVLTRVSDRITSEVDGINRVVYDITGKPPATIEWE